MSKRFIDTNLFQDEWVNELSKDCKLFFIYHITTCDHAQKNEGEMENAFNQHSDDFHKVCHS